MRIVTLYTGGGVSLSPTQREGSVEADYVRLVAEDGYAIINGEYVDDVIDVRKSDVQNWHDCEKPPTPPEPEPEASAEEIVDILTGVSG